MSKGSKGLPNSTEVLRLLWQEEFFAKAKSLSEISEHMSARGFNPQAGGLSMALKRATFLSKKGKRGKFVYLQVAPPTSPTGIRSGLFEQYDLHPKIKEVSLSQFHDGHFKEAIQNALVEVIDQVKQKTNNPTITTGNGRKVELDGDDLMQHVFAADGQTPKVAFNNLRTSLDRAEQRGFMYIFKGIVGIRDRKAHLNFVQKDPIKTLEFLSLASLLLRLLDENA